MLLTSRYSLHDIDDVNALCVRFTQAYDEVGTPGTVVVRAVVLGPLSPAGLVAVLPAADVRIDFNLASGEQGRASLRSSDPASRRTRSSRRI